MEIMVNGEILSGTPFNSVIFCYDSIEHETEKAFLIKRNGFKYWIPKSKIMNHTSEDYVDLPNIKHFVIGNFLFSELSPID